MWLVSLFSGSLVLPVLILGVILVGVSSVIGWMPLLKQYKIIISAAGWVLIVFGVYCEGGLSYKNSQAKAVAELQAKLSAAEAKSAQANTQIGSQVAATTQVIHDKGQTLIQYVNHNIVKYDSTCIIPKEVIVAHNAAVTLTMPPVDLKSTTTPAAVTTSPVKPKGSIFDILKFNLQVPAVSSKSDKAPTP